MLSCRYFLCIGLAMAILSGVLMEGSFLHCVLCFAPVIWVIAPACVIMGIICLFKRSTAVWPARFLGVLMTTLLMFVLSFLVGTGVHQWRKNGVENYVEDCVPVLDAYKVRTGSFPKSLDEAGLPPPPEWIKNGYDSDGSSFRFHYEDPAAMIGGYSFESIERRWIQWG